MRNAEGHGVWTVRVGLSEVEGGVDAPIYQQQGEVLVWFMVLVQVQTCHMSLVRERGG